MITYMKKEVEAEISTSLNKGDPKVIKEKTGTVIETSSEERMGNVGVKFGITRNLGNIDSLRIDVTLFQPCGMAVEDRTATFQEISDWCEDRLEALVSKIDS